MSYYRDSESPPAAMRGGRAMARRSGVPGNVTAFGDVSGAAVADLITQVNRFTKPYGGSTTPFVAVPFATGNGLTSALARTALEIYSTRLIVAQAHVADAGTAATIAAVAAATANPVPYVTAHLSEVTAGIRGYADSLGLSGSGGITELLASTGIPPIGYVAIAATIGAVWYFTSRRGR